MPRCLLQQTCVVFILTLSLVYCHPVPTYQNETRLRFTARRHKPHLFYSGSESAETLSWVVRLDADLPSSTNEELNTIAERIAEDTQLVNHGQVGELRGHYLFASSLDRHILRPLKSDALSESHAGDLGTTLMRENLTFTSQGNLSHSDWERVKLRSLILLDNHPFVEWHIQQVVRTRSKRDFLDLGKTQRHRDRGFLNQTEVHSEVKKRRARRSDLNKRLQFNDPLFPKQWHLVNTNNPRRDINISGIWLHNITGKGVTIAVVDDGLEWTNPDLAQNYNAEGSFDLNSNDADPSPSSSKDTNHHGTRCAGEIAAVANNGVCGVGVAYEAQISGIRILDGPMTDDLEAVAFTKKLDVNDVYSCSWGPEDDGKTVDGPQHLATIAMRHGVDYGRHGYGAIYVVASGNGGRVNDNCNYDGYANSIYTVTVGAIDEDGEMPYYGESCASMLAVTYSSGGGGYQRNIVTTDWTKNGGTGCTESHSGTSAAAPIASSLIGLMLQARPCLTWRDVQYIIAVSAVKVDMSKSEWTRNAAGLYHSHQHGFGELKAWRMVTTAKVWKTIPWLTLFTSKEIDANLAIPPTGSVLAKYEVTEKLLDGYNLNTLEYVHVKIMLTHERRGDVNIELICPSGTSSIIGATRKLDESKDGFKGWTFSTVRCWGEQPLGTWTLKITDTGGSRLQSRGSLIVWQLQLYGSMMTSMEVAERIRLVDEASSGKYLNDSYHLPCQPPPVQAKLVEVLSERFLKILLLTGCFLMFMALYETFEYAFCYNDEKKEQANLLQLSERAQQLSEQQSPDEVTHLLQSEEIEMETVATAQESRNGVTSFQHEVPQEQDLLLALDEELNEHEALITPYASSREEVLNKHETVINRSFPLGEDLTDDLIIELNKELALDGVDSEEVDLLQ